MAEEHKDFESFQILQQQQNIDNAEEDFSDRALPGEEFFGGLNENDMIEDNNVQLHERPRQVQTCKSLKLYGFEIISSYDPTVRAFVFEDYITQLESFVVSDFHSEEYTSNSLCPSLIFQVWWNMISEAPATSNRTGLAFIRNALLKILFDHKSLPPVGIELAAFFDDYTTKKKNIYFEFSNDDNLHLVAMTKLAESKARSNKTTVSITDAPVWGLFKNNNTKKVLLFYHFYYYYLSFYY
jgi:hypothetical protein